MAILADTSFLIALLDGDDPHHAEARALLKRPDPVFLVPFVVLPEVCYLSHKYLGPEVEVRFLEGLVRGEVAVEWGEPEDLRRCVEILRGRREFGMVDSTVMAIAERLKIEQIATFDRRHFGSFRPAHCSGFELLPRP